MPRMGTQLGRLTWFRGATPAVLTSWGVLLEEAQNVKVLIFQPWLVIPAVLVILAVLGFNFVGDGLRDAVDPYSR